MKALTYIEHGKFALSEKPKPEILDPRDAVVRVTLGSICTSDLHIKHGSVPRAVPGITVGHEMVGMVESVGSAVTTVKPGDRVTVNAKEKHAMRYTHHRGLAAVTRWVRLKYAAMNLKKLAIWSGKNSIFPSIFAFRILFSRRTPAFAK